jgi:hypothetical protein
MKRPGPPFGSGPGSDTKLRDVGQRSHTRSDTGRASRPSASSTPASRPATPSALLVGTALLIVLKARGRSRFDALFGETRLVKASANPISDAARVLHRQGHQDDRPLVVRHDGADHDAVHGRLGVWRRLRVREDRGPPRHVAWEPLPRRVRAKKGRTEEKATGHRPGKTEASTTPPGAATGHSPPPAPSTIGILDPEVSDA